MRELEAELGRSEEGRRSREAEAERLIVENGLLLRRVESGQAEAEALRTEAQELGILRRRHQGEAEEVDARLRRLSQEPDVEPDRTPAQAAARRLLREHGIAHAPLFAAGACGTPNRRPARRRPGR